MNLARWWVSAVSSGRAPLNWWASIAAARERNSVDIGRTVAVLNGKRTAQPRMIYKSELPRKAAHQLRHGPEMNTESLMSAVGVQWRSGLERLRHRLMAWRPVRAPARRRARTRRGGAAVPGPQHAAFALRARTPPMAPRRRPDC